MDVTRVSNRTYLSIYPDSSLVPTGEFSFEQTGLHLLRRKRLRDKLALTFFAPMPNPGERMGKKASAI